MPQLRVTKGASRGGTHMLLRGTVRLGRGGGIDPHDKQASRQHAELSYRDGLFFLKDVESRNGTFLNGERLQPRQEVALCHGDIIRIGGTELMFEQAASASQGAAEATEPRHGAVGVLGLSHAQSPRGPALDDSSRRVPAVPPPAPSNQPPPPPVPGPPAPVDRSPGAIVEAQGRAEGEQAGSLIAQGWWTPALGIHDDYIADVFRPLSCSSPVGLYATGGGLKIESRPLRGAEKLRVGLSLAYEMAYISFAILWFLVALPFYLLCVPFQLLALNLEALTTLQSALMAPALIVFAVVRWAQALKELVLLLICVCKGGDYYWVPRGWQSHAPDLATLGRGDVSQLHMLRARPQSGIVSGRTMLYLFALGVVAHCLKGMIQWMAAVEYASLALLVFMVVVYAAKAAGEAPLVFAFVQGEAAVQEAPSLLARALRSAGLGAASVPAGTVMGAIAVHMFLPDKRFGEASAGLRSKIVSACQPGQILE